MQFLATYLKLAQEFGGIEFGPYEDLEISLGSQKASCNIFIPPNFGVLPIHAKLIRKSATDVVLAPAEQSAEIFLWKGRSRNCIPIHVPTAVKSGDSFSLVSPQGPKFTIEFRELPPEEVKIRQESIARKKGLSGRNRLSKESMANEAKRQLWTTILVSGPAQLAQRAVVFVKSGAIYQPRNIFLGLTIIGGYVFGGFTACKGRKTQAQLSTTTTLYNDCQKSNEYIKEMNETKDYSFGSVVYRLASPELSEALKDDSQIQKEVQKEARFLFEEDYSKGSPYHWIIKSDAGPKRRAYRSWIKAFGQAEGDALDLATKKTLMWIPPIKNTPKNMKDFRVIKNSKDETVCGRGIFGLSYRQAKNLGLSAQPDAIFDGKEAQVTKETKRNSVLLTKVGEYKIENSLLPPYYQDRDEGEELPPAPESTWQQTKGRGKEFCIHQTGNDDRESSNRLISMLKKQYGKTDMERATIVSKIARLYTADLPGENYNGKTQTALKFTNKIGSSLDRSDLSGSDWAKKQTARVIARSLVLPCIITLKGEEEAKKDFFDESNPPPDPVMCFALNWSLTEGNN